MVPAGFSKNSQSVLAINEPGTGAQEQNKNPFDCLERIIRTAKYEGQRIPLIYTRQWETDQKQTLPSRGIIGTFLC